MRGFLRGGHRWRRDNEIAAAKKSGVTDRDAAGRAKVCDLVRAVEVSQTKSPRFVPNGHRTLGCLEVFACIRKQGSH